MTAERILHGLGGGIERYGVEIAVAVAIVIGLALLFSLRRASARIAGAQVAAVPVRRTATGTLEVLLITTRGSGRWTVPKGWPMRGLPDPDAAAREAYEEAGVRGRVDPRPIGSFEYVKRNRFASPLRVTVYRLDVERQVRHFRERGQRKSVWLEPVRAAERVAWPGLAAAIRALDSR